MASNLQVESPKQCLSDGLLLAQPLQFPPSSGSLDVFKDQLIAQTLTSGDEKSMRNNQQPTADADNFFASMMSSDLSVDDWYNQACKWDGDITTGVPVDPALSETSSQSPPPFFPGQYIDQQEQSTTAAVEMKREDSEQNGRLYDTAEVDRADPYERASTDLGRLTLSPSLPPIESSPEQADTPDTATTTPNTSPEPLLGVKEESKADLGASVWQVPWGFGMMPNGYPFQGFAPATPGPGSRPTTRQGLPPKDMVQGVMDNAIDPYAFLAAAQQFTAPSAPAPHQVQQKALMWAPPAGGMFSQAAALGPQHEAVPDYNRRMMQQRMAAAAAAAATTPGPMWWQQQMYQRAMQQQMGMNPAYYAQRLQTPNYALAAPTGGIPIGDLRTAASSIRSSATKQKRHSNPSPGRVRKQPQRSKSTTSKKTSPLRNRHDSNGSGSICNGAMFGQYRQPQQQQQPQQRVVPPARPESPPRVCPYKELKKPIEEPALAAACVAYPDDDTLYVPRNCAFTTPDPDTKKQIIIHGPAVVPYAYWQGGPDFYVDDDGYRCFFTSRGRQNIVHWTPEEELFLAWVHREHKLIKDEIPRHMVKFAMIDSGKLPMNHLRPGETIRIQRNRNAVAMKETRMKPKEPTKKDPTPKPPPRINLSMDFSVLNPEEVEMIKMFREKLPPVDPRRLTMLPAY